MITFANVDNPNDKRTTIPKQVNSRFKYNMYCGDKVVGTTYGIAVKRLVVETPGFGRYQFDVDLHNYHHPFANTNYEYIHLVIYNLLHFFLSLLLFLFLKFQ